MKRFDAVVLLFLSLLTGCSSLPKPQHTGQTWNVGTGQDLQWAIDNAVPGETILLENGATFTGNYFLPFKNGEGWVTVRPRSLEGLPPPGSRMTPALAATLPVLLTPNSRPVISTAISAHHFRFQALRFGLAVGVWATNHIQLGSGNESLSALPHHIDFDQVLLQADPAEGSVRGIALNGHHLAVRNSSIIGYGRPKLDTQALCAWNSPGPLHIANDYLEGAAENIMLGGGTPAIPGLVASDVVIVGNHLFKPLAWQSKGWVVKNLFEIKSGRRVRVEGNVLENIWPAEQRGFAVVLTVRTEDGKAPQAVVEDITFARNWVRNATSGVNILGRDTNQLGRSQRISLTVNQFDLAPSPLAPTRLLQILEGVDHVEFAGNVATNATRLLMAEGPPSKGFIFRNNHLTGGVEGFQATGVPSGQAVLERLFPGTVLSLNRLDGVAAHSLFAHQPFIKVVPPANDLPASLQTALQGKNGPTRFPFE